MNFQIYGGKSHSLMTAGAVLLFMLCRLSEAQERFIVPSKDGAQISVQK